MFGWLSSVGRFLGKAIGRVRDTIPEPVLRFAIATAKEAANRYVDNTTRREWAVGQVRTTTGVSESVARLAVELAVQVVKSKIS